MSQFQVGLFVILLSGCGYSLGYRAPTSVRTVAVPIFDNQTFPLRRDVEYELTSAFRKELQARTDLRLTDSDQADMVVYGTVRYYRERVVAEGPSDQKTESVLVVVVGLAVEDLRNEQRSEVMVRDQEPVSFQTGETLDDGRRRAIKNLAERMVLAIESWE